jgi:putative iron-dependent peroxidase
LNLAGVFVGNAHLASRQEAAVSPKSSPISNAQRALDTEPQSIDAPLSAAAAFLVLVVKDDDASIATARSVVGSTGDLIKDLRIRANSGLFTCNVGISHRIWARVGR